MAKIPLPERGQPLDLSYIYQLANAINDLSAQVSVSTYNYLTVDTQSAGKQSVKVPDAKMIGGYIQVVNDYSKIDAGADQGFTFGFSNDFKYEPIVTATPVNVGGTTAGRDVTVVIDSVTTSSVSGRVKFSTTGTATVGVNLIIIGIPK